MPRLPFGNLGGALTNKNSVSFRNIRGGVVSAQELVVAGGNNGVVRSQNYDPSSELGWAAFGDGSASFYGDVTIGDNAVVLGDVYSSVWDGAIPANLSSGPVTASTGFYLDSSAGAIQAQELFVGGSTGNLILQSFSNIGSVLFGIEDLNFEGVITASVLEITPGEPSGTLSLSPPYDSGSRVELTLFGEGTSSDPFASFATFDYLIVPEGTVSQPGVAFNNDGDTGMYRAGINKIGFSVGGDEALVINANRLVEANISFAVNGETFKVFASNVVRSTGIRDDTTSNSANLVIGATTGDIQRTTSSLKYKPGWLFVDEGVLAELEMPTPITWEDKQGGTMLGFGTEHVHAMLEAATQDNYENYDVRSLVAILSAKVKRLEREVAALS